MQNDPVGVHVVDAEDWPANDCPRGARTVWVCEMDVVPRRSTSMVMGESVLDTSPVATKQLELVQSIPIVNSDDHFPGSISSHAPPQLRETSNGPLIVEPSTHSAPREHAS